MDAGPVNSILHGCRYEAEHRTATYVILPERVLQHSRSQCFVLNQVLTLEGGYRARRWLADHLDRPGQ